MKSSRFAAYVWMVLAFIVLVILWGAVVRATGSGAGCGSHWPLCNGEVIPETTAIATPIEFFHRVTSGIALLLVIALLLGALRTFTKGHLVRLGAVASFIFIVVESLIGAIIVAQELTAKNSSIARAAIIAVHQANTLLLLGAIALTGWWASGGSHLRLRRLRSERATSVALLGGVIGLVLLSATGAITALGDTLFPAQSLQEGVVRDLAPTAHFLEQLRIVHPIVAGLMGVYVVALSWWIARHAHNAFTKWLASTLTGLFLAQCALGLVNVASLAPVWIQLAHLLLADVVWITFVLLGASLLAPQAHGQLAVQPTQSTKPALSAK